MATVLSVARFHDTALEPSARRSWQAPGSRTRTAWRSTAHTTSWASAGWPTTPGEARHGDAGYFVWNAHVNHTNVCVATCDFCAFAAKSGEERAYTMALEDVFKNVSGLPKQVREVHIVGGLHPDLPWSYFIDMMKGHQADPAGHPHQGLHRSRDLLLSEALPDVLRAGPDRAQGGGSGLDAGRRCGDLCRRDPEQDHQGQGGRRGVARRDAKGPTSSPSPSNATMLYGHVESVEDRVDHLVRLRELQDETGGFVTFIPLAFQPWEAPAMTLPETTGFEDLKAIAVSRLLLDNFPHIKSYWIMITPRLAQVGLSFGADDMDGTVTEEKIAHDAGASTPQVMTVQELVRLIREAGAAPRWSGTPSSTW